MTSILLRTFLCFLLFTRFAIAQETQHPLETPNKRDVIEYAFDGFCTQWICLIHEAKSTQAKRIYAQGYYGALFVMWFGCANPRVQHVTDYDLSGNVCAFRDKAVSMQFRDLIDFADPLNKYKGDKNTYDTLISSWGGSPYFSWVLSSCSNDAIYNGDVAHFRTYIDKVGK